LSGKFYQIIKTEAIYGTNALKNTDLKRKLDSELFTFARKIVSGQYKGQPRTERTVMLIGSSQLGVFPYELCVRNFRLLDHARWRVSHTYCQKGGEIKTIYRLPSRFSHNMTNYDENDTYWQPGGYKKNLGRAFWRAHIFINKIFVVTEFADVIWRDKRYRQRKKSHFAGKNSQVENRL
jgi:hypothetical protein